MDVDEVLAELAARAESSRWNESWTYDADAYARRAADWVAIARVTGRLRIVPAPDPRIAHAIEDVLWTTPSDNWFHADQVTHVIGSLAHDPNAPNEPSFADHAFALLAAHADPNMPKRLDELADRTMIEADCNGVEMAERLRALSRELAARFDAG
jgi:hypothetical protein